MNVTEQCNLGSIKYLEIGVKFPDVLEDEGGAGADGLQGHFEVGILRDLAGQLVVVDDPGDLEVEVLELRPVDHVVVDEGDLEVVFSGLQDVNLGSEVIKEEGVSQGTLKVTRY